MGEKLVKTLQFPLAIDEGEPDLFIEACYEARAVYNETIRLALDHVSRKQIHSRIDSSLIKNSQQRVVEKALRAVKSYRNHENYNPPSSSKSSPYPLRMNYLEGFILNAESNDQITFRISVKPFTHISGRLCGNSEHLDLIRKAITGDNWNIGVSEGVMIDTRFELHIPISRPLNNQIRNSNQQTIIGIDINESNVTLSATDGVRILDSISIEYPELKMKRHQYLTIRKRLQSSNKTKIFDVLRSSEKNFVRDIAHKVSRAVIYFAEQFANPSLVLEDLKNMRESIYFGPELNRRLHSIPFRKLQQYISYKASFSGIPDHKVNPAYTSQSCPDCGHKERGNRHKGRFRCQECGFQDNADRTATINITTRYLNEINSTVPTLKKLPKLRKLRWRASGPVDGPTPIHDVPFEDGTNVIVDVLS